MMWQTYPMKFSRTVAFSGQPPAKPAEQIEAGSGPVSIRSADTLPVPGNVLPLHTPDGLIPIRFGARSKGIGEEDEAEELIKVAGTSKKDPKAIDYHRYNRKNTIAPLGTYHALVKPGAQEYHRQNGEILEKHIKGTGEYYHIPWIKHQRKLGEIPYVVFDTETTGIRKYDRIIQIALSKVDKNHEVRHLADYNTLVHPGYNKDGEIFPIHPRAQETHGITPEMLSAEGIPQMMDILKELRNEIIGETALAVAYNAKFDVGMMNETVERWNKSKNRNTALLRPLETALVLDPYILYQRLHPFNAASRKLTNHFEILMGTSLENAHDAQADVDATVDVLKYCFKYLEKRQIPLEWAKFVESQMPKNRKWEDEEKRAYIAEVVRNNRQLFEERMPVKEVEPLKIVDILRFQHGSPVFHDENPGLPKLDISLGLFGWDGSREWDGTDVLDRGIVEQIRTERDQENRKYLTHKFRDDISSAALNEMATAIRKIRKPNSSKPDSYKREAEIRKELMQGVGDMLVTKFFAKELPNKNSDEATASYDKDMEALKGEIEQQLRAYLDQSVRQTSRDANLGRLYNHFMPRLVDDVARHVEAIQKELGQRYFYTKVEIDPNKPLIDPMITRQLAMEKSTGKRGRKVASSSNRRQAQIITTPKGDAIDSGLIIKGEWLDRIFDGGKTWEIRGRNTNKRGPIALIQSGTGHVFGTAELVDVVGPLSKEEMLANVDKHQIPAEEIEAGMPYQKTYAYVLKNPKRFETPTPYDHNLGAVTWVKLPVDTKALPSKPKIEMKPGTRIDMKG